MNSLFREFIRKIYRLELRAKHLLKENLIPWQTVYSTEGLISDAWQAWNFFCKTLLLMSCQGCSGRTGQVYLPRPLVDNSIERIACEVKSFGNGSTSQPAVGKKIHNPWSYPTWGDGTKILNAIAGLNTQNASILTVAFSLPLKGHIELQTIRNFLFHKDTSSIARLASLTCFKGGGAVLSHPSLIAWEANSNNEIIFFTWLDDIKHIAYNATI